MFLFIPYRLHSAPFIPPEKNLLGTTQQDGCVQGAAHFLEHMLFLGNRRYPGEGELDAYLARHAGDSNAFTEAHHACFHCDADADGMRGALDRLAHLFVEPRLRADAMAREVRAACRVLKRVCVGGTRCARV